ncbi:MULTISPECIES: helix-turn-helix domain-containing protein [unclassified Streptomyces]|uniref:helix-turn-helix domain-containing protein n=1 Tax=unclassified Streptomyces TaxID=2593676 RepID=UPI000F97A682|nr:MULTISPECIES: helix-turn-helix domain-containing protein [unclassified Streptomyces]WSG55186.1 helix-turn-helix domain-containing protein [Streptomyces sp. NBC_01732]WSX05899.1 helix-turn-helix domain-containing protein [Streptomyces sp. NBC_00987]MCX4391836.1 helix-turn-helix domain-containing protein [Streptomyces sp. NBC_01767]MCX5103961.1 helix-turn-helix domain-containing protein [Streptomyces sp. NBC_00439]MCX5164990.1 helix-turn-helix domain-containing protein [Streptomyces sp. NBC_0
MRTSLGIDSVARSVYISMVDRPGAEVAELAAQLKESEETVRGGLERLSALLLVVPGDSASGWRPIDPEVGLAAMLTRQQEELARHRLQVEGSRLEVTRLLSERGHGGRESVPDVKWLAGADAVWRHITFLAGECATEWLTVGPAERPDAAAFEAGHSLDEILRRHGTPARAIVLESVRNDPEATERLRRNEECGGAVRTLPSLPVWMIVSDRRHAVVPVTSGRSVVGAMACGVESVTEAFATLFARLWKEALPLAEARPRTRGNLSLQEQHVLRLWAQGLTDAAAARRMDVSLRTVRRLSEKLTDRFGAQSRFQLGALALASGGIRAEDMA